jgi:hypothetical protein
MRSQGSSAGWIPIIAVEERGFRMAVIEPP